MLIENEDVMKSAGAIFPNRTSLEPAVSSEGICLPTSRTNLRAKERERKKNKRSKEKKRQEKEDRLIKRNKTLDLSHFLAIVSLWWGPLSSSVA